MEKWVIILCLISCLDFIKVVIVFGDDMNFICYCCCFMGSFIYVCIFC